MRWPIAAQHQAVVLWGGWLLAGGAFFSVAGFFHPYYLSILGPAVAALVGIGAAGVWNLRQKRWWLALPVLAIAAGLTFVLQIRTGVLMVKARMHGCAGRRSVHPCFFVIVPALAPAAPIHLTLI